jgi:hypothetical protein
MSRYTPNELEDSHCQDELICALQHNNMQLRFYISVLQALLSQYEDAQEIENAEIVRNLTFDLFEDRT